ncbi:iron complex transport system permease protein [Nocardioides zeae]|uniref:Iron complex transport system permease protein n=2 Tax=Nocardioides zeae TaxID=1457234 RepID=A0ACC6IJE3_9ACTN|nr:iron chelate uptake ABC transporter family permease subunit [Nocardioides zeae]MDQ1102741.1 iron complex transport system permease protein [Nocardioides zeae]MDR6173484.1 iron complex transport system permease protein [Nocardioides zeae]MDR6210890.1 iron complex transport system permease protein [Nocardioides zeae]
MTAAVLAPPPAPAPERPSPSLGPRRAVGLVVLLAALVAAMAASLAFGANPLPFGAVRDGLLTKDGTEASLIVWDLRIPRTIAGLAVGAAFGVAGALVQALTRNPLADPGILGVNAGAGFAVTLGVGIFGVASVSGYVWFAFVGAAFATGLVYLIGAAGGGGASPITLVLAGVALAAVLGGVQQFLTLIDPTTFDRLRSWGVGSIDSTSLDDTLAVLPFLAVGLLVALALSGALNAVALGDDLATSLGTNILRTRVLGIVAVTLLAGGGTALTGGIGFVGLMVPHVVRWFTGPDQRWVIAYSAVAAPVLVLVADVVGRVLGRPGEIQVGIVTAVIGAPVLIALVRRQKASGL